MPYDNTPVPADLVNGVDINEAEDINRVARKVNDILGELGANPSGLSASIEARFDTLGGSGTHPDLTSHDSMGLATQAELDSHAATSGHTHPNLAAHDALGLATQAELDTHVAAADPHPTYQKESEKGAASGYAGLGTNGLVPNTQIATGVADSTTFHRGDGTWAPAAGGSAHPDLAAHDTLGLATQAELDTHAATAGHTHPNLAAHDTLGLATQTELENLTQQLIPFSAQGALTVRTGTSRFRLPFAITLLGVSAAINTAPVGASVIADLNSNGTTVFSTQANRPTILTGANATASETVPDVTAIPAGNYLTVDIDQVGSTTAGSDLTIIVRYRRS